MSDFDKMMAALSGIGLERTTNGIENMDDMEDALLATMKEETNTKRKRSEKRESEKRKSGRTQAIEKNYNVSKAFKTMLAVHKIKMKTQQEKTKRESIISAPSFDQTPGKIEYFELTETNLEEKKTYVQMLYDISALLSSNALKTKNELSQQYMDYVLDKGNEKKFNLIISKLDFLREQGVLNNLLQGNYKEVMTTLTGEIKNKKQFDKFFTLGKEYPYKYLSNLLNKLDTLSCTMDCTSDPCPGICAPYNPDQDYELPEDYMQSGGAYSTALKRICKKYGVL